MSPLLKLFLIAAGAAVINLWFAWMEMPRAQDKKTGRQRSYRERWRLMTWQVRGQLIGGLVSAAIAAYCVLKFLTIIP